MKVFGARSRYKQADEKKEAVKKRHCVIAERA